jgi:hypothetical protein
MTAGTVLEDWDAARREAPGTTEKRVQRKSLCISTALGSAALTEGARTLSVQALLSTHST